MIIHFKIVYSWSGVRLGCLHGLQHQESNIHFKIVQINIHTTLFCCVGIVFIVRTRTQIGVESWER